MKKESVLAVYVSLCVLETYQLNIPEASLYIFSGIIIRCSGLPLTFYEMIDEFDDIDAKYEIFQPSFKFDNESTTTATTKATEMPMPKFDSWKKRGTYRLECVDEVGVSPTKVVNLMSDWHWESSGDLLLQKWVLCVLHKMGIMSMEGVFKMDEALSKIPPKYRESAERLIDHCLPKKPTEPHKIAWHYVKCHNLSKGNFSEISIF